MFNKGNNVKGIMSKVMFGMILLAFLAQNIRTQDSQNSTQEISVNDNDKFQHFMNFIKKFGKNYTSKDQFLLRFQVFKDNLQNQNITIVVEEESSNDTFTKGVGPFTDMTPEEFAKRFLTFNGTGIQLPPLPENMKEENFLQDSSNSGRSLQTSSLPTNWDWRNYGAVTSVKNQGVCGCCWSFSTAANLEGQYFLKYGKLISFSEQQLMDCDTTNSGCNGGNAALAYIYLKSAGGIQSDTAYPYQGKQSTCKFNASQAIAKVSGYYYMGKDENLLMYYLKAYGPLAAAMNGDPLQFYTSGIINLTSATCDPTKLNHAVTLVGYGTSASGYDYWIVKNSWSTWWGEKGYFRILRNTGACGINTAVTTGIVQ